MNRKYKFRFWSYNTKRFINPARIEVNQNGEFFDLHCESIEPQQFTGLKDRDGKDIYEGDIIRRNDGKEYLSLQDIKEKQLTKNSYSKFEVLLPERLNWITKDVVVLGNAAENPELLK